MATEGPVIDQSRLARKQAVYRHLGDVHVELAVELGRKRIPLDEARRMAVTDVIVLDKLAGESFEIQANGYTFALGEIVVDRDQLTCRITQFIQQPQR